MSQDPFVDTALGAPSHPSREADVVDVLRRAVSELEALMAAPSQHGDEHHTGAALHAVHRALIELEPLARRHAVDDGPRPLL